jgi:hypothetical protein
VEGVGVNMKDELVQQNKSVVIGDVLLNHEQNKRHPTFEPANTYA